MRDLGKPPSNGGKIKEHEDIGWAFTRNFIFSWMCILTTPFLSMKSKKNETAEVLKLRRRLTRTTAPKDVKLVYVKSSNHKFKRSSLYIYILYKECSSSKESKDQVHQNVLIPVTNSNIRPK